MPCEWTDLAVEVAWQAFKRKLKERILRKLVSRTAIAAAIALIDGPLPVGDAIGLAIELWTLLETGISLWEAWHAWDAVRTDTIARTRRLVADLTKRFGNEVLENSCVCECLQAYLRNLARARLGGSPRFKRALISEVRKLMKCAKDCLR